MPEAEAITDGVNGFFFEEDNIEDLENKIIKWFNRIDGVKSKEQIRNIIDEKYNPLNQMQIIYNMIDKWQE